MSNDPVSISQNDRIKLERLYRLANKAMLTISLQCRRVMTNEPEDTFFVMRRQADLYFLILALIRLRTIVKIGGDIEFMKQDIEDALAIFDIALPNIITARNVIEHLNDYAVDKGKNKKVSRKQLEVDTWDGSTFKWLDIKLNVKDSQNAAVKLFGTIKKIICEAWALEA